jgi:hypothetical protein
MKLLLKQSDFSTLNSSRNINANFENRIQDNEINSSDSNHLIKAPITSPFIK